MDRSINWGPKPFRTLDCWFDHPDFKNFVKSNWQELNFEGKPAFVLKEKLKALKGRLREWNRDCFGFLNSKINNVKAELHCVEMKLENPSPSEAAIERKKSKNAELWQLLRRKENLTF